VDPTGTGSAGDVTGLLRAWKNGDPHSVDKLFQLVYEELRVVARGLRRRSSLGASVETTALVHETYLRLVNQTRASLEDRRHFFVVAAKAMRNILVDDARARSAQKRGGGEVEVTLEEDAASTEHAPEDIVAVDTALSKLETLDPRLAEIVEMRFFGGLSVEEIAESLGLSSRTVKRDWKRARAFLLLELSGPSR
jgi:RNA polymerase sigma factor (TIGR02999 family)